MSKESTRARLLWLDELMGAVANGLLPPSAFNVGYVVSGYINSESRIAWPSEATMAARIGLEEGTVQKRISQLRSAGFLTVSRVNRKLTNRYQLARPSKSYDNAKTDPYLNAGQSGPDPQLKPGATRTGMRLISLSEPFNSSPPPPESVPAIETALRKETEDAFENPSNALNSIEPICLSALPAAAPDDDEISQLNLRKIFGDKATAKAVRKAPSVIRRWIAEGFDLRADIVPFLEDLARKLKNPLFDLGAHTFCKDLADRHKDRLSRPAASAPSAIAPIKVLKDSPEGRACENRFIAERGKKPPWGVGSGGREECWWFPADWPEIRAGPGAEP